MESVTLGVWGELRRLPGGFPEVSSRWANNRRVQNDVGWMVGVSPVTGEISGVLDFDQVPLAGPVTIWGDSRGFEGRSGVDRRSREWVLEAVLAVRVGLKRPRDARCVQ